jgi:gas vesicle protein
MKTSLIFLLGLGMGTVLGLLVAPDSGRVTISKIREEADKLIDKALTGNLNLLGKNGKNEEFEPADPTVVIVEERYTI